MLNTRPLEIGNLNFFDACAFKRYIIKPLQEENP